MSSRQSAYEWCALLLLLLPSLAGMWAFGAVRLWSVGPLLVLNFCGLCLFLLRPLFFPDTAGRLAGPPGGAWALLFAALAWLRVPWAAVPHEAAIAALRVLSLVGAWWAWTTLAGHHRRWRWIVGLLLFSVTLMGWYALIQHGHGSNHVLTLVRPEQYGMRASGAYICPNHFAHLIALTLPVALALALSSQAGAFLRLLGGYSLLVLLPALYLTQSRSGWLGALAGFAVVGCLKGWRAGTRRFLLAVLVVPLMLAGAAFLVWLVSPVVQERVAAALAGDIRLELWRDTLDVIRSSPWLGHGPGSFRWVYPGFRRHMFTYLDPEFAHNEYLHLAAEYGLIGVAVLAALVLIIVVRLFPFIRGADREKDSSLIVGWLGALAASLVHAGFDYNLHIFSNVHALVALGGVTASGLFAAGGLNPLAVRVTAHRVAGLLLALLLAAASLQTLRLLVGYWQVRRAGEEQAALRYESARALYERARRVDSADWRPWLGLGELDRSLCFWTRDPAARGAIAERAIERYRASLARNPWEVDALYGMARVRLLLGEREQGIALLQDAVRRAPSHAFYLCQLGAVLRDAGRLDEARAAFEQSQRAQASELAERNLAWIRERLAEAQKP